MLTQLRATSAMIRSAKAPDAPYRGETNPPNQAAHDQRKRQDRPAVAAVSSLRTRVRDRYRDVGDTSG